ncbi:MAG TPA: hypothetical protein VFX13_04385 [Gaiellales bacterium]|jgi:hypothetical protein|nr:hypothetical protein [Gaiellales bacterium]
MENAAVQLRVYLPIPSLERQFAAYLGTPTRARGYPPVEGDHALIVEVAPALAIERVTDLALRSVPEIEPGILYVERQFGVLEVHHRDKELVDRAGAAILEGIGATAADALRPRILYADVIEDITDQHAVIINRNREASMVLPGETLLVYEVVPALHAAMAANAAERAAPDATLVIVSMIGAAGRIYLSGATESVVRARDAITRVLESVEGREH